MSNYSVRMTMRAHLLALLLFTAGAGAMAQTPSPTPPDLVPQAMPVLQEPRPPNFPDVPQQTVPPLPDLTRLGVLSSNVLALSVNDAIRRALQNNNDIEVARDDVRVAEQRLRALY
ncbi:MAG: hypothetical protein DMF70_09275, partial [Acidobacteria bacterium]